MVSLAVVVVLGSRRPGNRRTRDAMSSRMGVRYCGTPGTSSVGRLRSRFSVRCRASWGSLSGLLRQQYRCGRAGTRGCDPGPHPRVSLGLARIRRRPVPRRLLASAIATERRRGAGAPAPIRTPTPAAPVTAGRWKPPRLHVLTVVAGVLVTRGVGLQDLEGDRAGLAQPQIFGST